MKEDQAEVVEPPLPPWDPRGPQPADPSAPGENVRDHKNITILTKTSTITTMKMLTIVAYSGRRGELESRKGGSGKEETDRQRLEGQRL